MRARVCVLVVHRLHGEYLAVMCRVLTLLCFGFFPTELFTRTVWATRRNEKLKPQAQRDCKKNLLSSARLKHETYRHVMQTTAIQRILISYRQYYCCNSADGVEISPAEIHMSDRSCSSRLLQKTENIQLAQRKCQKNLWMSKYLWSLRHLERVKVLCVTAVAVRWRLVSESKQQLTLSKPSL